MLSRFRFGRYYRYPHYQWAMAIKDILGTAAMTDETVLIDAPCGDGAVSYWLIKERVGRKYELYDTSAREIQAAAVLRSWQASGRTQVSVERKDVFQIETHTSTRDIWLLINSLFLLPKVDELIERMRPRAQHIVGLFPYTDHRNYRCFLRLDPHTNINAMDPARTISFFAKHGYELRATRDVSFIAYHCLKPKLLRQVSRYVLTPVECLVPKRHPCYWIGLFSRGADGAFSP